MSEEAQEPVYYFGPTVDDLELPERTKSRKDTRFLVPLTNANGRRILDLVAKTHKAEVTRLLLEGTPHLSLTTERNGEPIIYNGKDGPEVQTAFSGFFIYQCHPDLAEKGPKGTQVLLHDRGNRSAPSSAYVGLFGAAWWRTWQRMFRKDRGIAEPGTGSSTEQAKIPEGGLTAPVSQGDQEIDLPDDIS